MQEAIEGIRLIPGTGGGTTGDDNVIITARIIYGNEVGTSSGNYGAINRDDNGASSIGQIQWRAERAYNLLNRIKGEDPTIAASILGTSLINELNSNDSSLWHTKILTEAEASKVSQLLTTDVGKRVQDAQAREDVQGYINWAASKGITDPKAQAFIADCYNQGPADTGDIVNRCIARGDLSLDALYQSALEDTVLGVGDNRTRRTTTYEKCKNTVFQTTGGSTTGVNVSFNSGIDSSVVSTHTINVLKQVLADAGLSSATITSTLRTPESQANAMYDNCENTGAQAQKDIYASAGDQVIDTYIQGKQLNKTRTEIITDMVNKINDLWPERVSLHCVPISEYQHLNVIDVSQSSIANGTSFCQKLDVAVSNGTINSYLVENGCYHIEVPVP